MNTHQSHQMNQSHFGSRHCIQLTSNRTRPASYKGRAVCSHRKRRSWGRRGLQKGRTRIDCPPQEGKLSISGPFYERRWTLNAARKIVICFRLWLTLRKKKRQQPEAGDVLETFFDPIWGKLIRIGSLLFFPGLSIRQIGKLIQHL